MSTNEGDTYMPFFVPVCAPSEENGDHNGSITYVRVPTVGLQSALPVFTSKESYWKFEEHPAFEQHLLGAIPCEMDPFELENLVVGLEGSGLELVAFDLAVTSDGLWESPLPLMPIEHFRRLLADVGPAFDELVVASYMDMYGGQPQEPQGLMVRARKLFSRLKAVFT
jgi:hypothetical protein